MYSAYKSETGYLYENTPTATILRFNVEHRWELLGNKPISTVVMAIYHYVERIWRILVTHNFSYNINDNENIIQMNQLIYIYNN